MTRKASGETGPPATAESDDGKARSGGVRRGSLHWAKSLLNRSIVLEKRRNQLHVVLVDRSPQALRRQASSLLTQMRDELRARLLVHDRDAAGVRHLYAAHKALEARGWPGVDGLPLKMLSRVVAEAEMLQGLEPSALMAQIVERLAAAKAEVEGRVERDAKMQEKTWLQAAVPEVSEASHEEYELTERSWMGTMPAALGASGHGPLSR